MLDLQTVRKEYDRYDEGWKLVSISNDKYILDEITYCLQDQKIVSMLLDYGEESMLSLGYALLYVRPQDVDDAKAIVEQYNIY
ncbi:hypothetical protein K5X82_14750 [Halosquirtibacter xylanolyticus]|uniref:hypothetical protein n=1 Tax=Halosquirtibacter xylanolyticus TaxID=3374599 RepID=UPI0037482EBF|nr:hypothetical protein K5X82_14750 [Prolixibacteraceae bacterium]